MNAPPPEFNPSELSASRAQRRLLGRLLKSSKLPAAEADQYHAELLGGAWLSSATARTRIDWCLRHIEEHHRNQQAAARRKERAANNPHPTPIS